jgi:hypothetical protein
MPTPADLIAFARSKAEDARREVTVRQIRATAWEDTAARTAGPDRQAAIAKVSVERSIADHHRHAAEMFDAMAEALTEGIEHRAQKGPTP